MLGEETMKPRSLVLQSRYRGFLFRQVLPIVLKPKIVPRATERSPVIAKPEAA